MFMFRFQVLTHLRNHMFSLLRNWVLNVSGFCNQPFDSASTRNLKFYILFLHLPFSETIMKHLGILIYTLVFLSVGMSAQVTNVNISGSYDGVFTLSGTKNEYKIGGSPYLSESWMFGTLELKEAMIGHPSHDENANSQVAENLAMIEKCNDLIRQISDTEYRTVALRLSRAGKSTHNKNDVSGIEIDERDFKELSGMIENFEKDLLDYLVNLRAEYSAGMEEINQLNGLFRYNLYAQEFEMIFNRDTFAIKSPLNVQSISMSNKKFIYGFYIDREFGNDYLGSSYFEVLNEGTCKLLARHEIKIKEHSGPVTHSWAGDGSDSFVKIRQLYFQKADGMEVVQLKKSKKHLKEIFADKYFEVEQYIRNEKINVKDEQELIRIFTYYNNLDS